MRKNISGGARQAKRSLDSTVSTLLALMYMYINKIFYMKSVYTGIWTSTTKKAYNWSS